MELRSAEHNKIKRSSVLRSLGEEGLNVIMYYIYILQSQKDRSYYTGITEDLKQRLREHNAGPFKIAFYCAFKDKKKALDFEKYLKSSSGFAFARKRFI